MKVLAAIGVLLMIAGGYVLVRGASFVKDRDVLSVGPLSASVEQRQAVPPWVGGLAIGVGLVVVIAGLSSRSRT